MKTRVYNPIHIEIQVIKFISVRIWSGSVNWDGNAVDDRRSFFHCRLNGTRVPFEQPSIERRYTHFEKMLVLLGFVVQRKDIVQKEAVAFAGFCCSEMQGLS